MNLIDDLLEEIDRNKEILKHYEALPHGVFGAIFIKKDIEFARNAIVDQNTVSMVRALKTLRETN